MKNIFANSSLSASAVAAIFIMGMVGSGQLMAQTCTIANWQVGGSAASVGLAESNVGLPTEPAPVGGNFRRYAGPCGLRVPVAGAPAYVRDGSPTAEAAYTARFYAYLDNAGSPLTIFQAVNAGGDAQVAVEFDPTASNLDLVVTRADGTPAPPLRFTDVPAGWHSIEFEWSAAAAADIVFALNSDVPADKLSATVDTTGREISEVRLGNVLGSGSNGSSDFVDFDDFDSRRSTPPGRLLRGDAAGTGTVTIADLFAVNSERTGQELAAGQPDCTEDGRITIADLSCVNAIRTGQQI